MSDKDIAELYDIPVRTVKDRRHGFNIKPVTSAIDRIERELYGREVWLEEELKSVLPVEYINGNIPHTNSTPLKSEKEFLYMKATGIVRRIDDLGRVVIPKEIRRTMRIREGDPLEIYTDIDGEVIFKKYSPMGELAEFTSQYCEVLFKAISMPVLITDRDRVVCSMGVTKKDAVDKKITSQLEKIMDDRSTFIATSTENNILKPVEGLEKNACIAVPIIGNGDLSGCVVVLFNDKSELPTQAEIKLAEVASQFLGKQTED